MKETNMKFDKFEGAYGPDANPGSLNRERVVIWAQGKAKYDEYMANPHLDVNPFDDALSKGDMTEHLREYHGVHHIGGQSVYPGMKMSKAALVEYHTNLHVRLDHPEGQFWPTGGSTYRDGVNVYTFGIGEWDEQSKRVYRPQVLPNMRHQHMAAVIPDSVANAAAAIRDNKPVGEKPLTAAEGKVLSELVNNDFAGLKAEMRAFAADNLSAKRAEINAEWDEKEAAIPDFAKDATETLRRNNAEWSALKAKHDEAMAKMRIKHEDALKEITDKAKAKGVTLNETQVNVTEEVNGVNRTVTRTVYKANVEGRTEALKAAEVENSGFLSRAEMTLERQRLDAQRRVLVSRVNPEAARILDSIPNAKSMMIEAQMDGAKQIASKTDA
jgi:hypothetical protein